MQRFDLSAGIPSNARTGMDATVMLMRASPLSPIAVAPLVEVPKGNTWVSAVELRNTQEPTSSVFTRATYFDQTDSEVQQ